MQKLMILAALVTGLLTFPMQSGAARPTTLVVDEHGRGCVAGDRVFRTIREAIDFLIVTEGGEYSPNDPRRIILVCPGVYDTTPDGGVNVPINSLIIVSTDRPERTIITGAFHYGFIINAHRVTVQGFTIVGGDAGVVNGPNIGIFIYGGHANRVFDNVVRNALTLGICIGTSNNIVEGNIVHANRDGIALGNIGCEQVASTEDNNDNIITHNTIRSNSRYGIVVWSNAAIDSTLGRTGNSLVGNTVSNNGTGIAISPTPEATLVAQRTTVEANSVHDNTTGILDQGGLTKCDGNNIRHNRVDGFEPQGACAPEDNQVAYVRGQ